jgi:ABC-type sugar transport system ATPase subunit
MESKMGDEPIVKMVEISKSFGGLKALDKVNFELYRGEVLALVGDNGAGKSTLIKILTGAYIADEGEIYIEGEQVFFREPKDTEKFGIAAIYQDLALIPTLDAPGNMFLGRELKKSFLGFGIKLLDRKRMMQETRKTLKHRLQMEISDLSKPVHVLSGGQQQGIAIARAVHAQAKILIMDEPVSALGTKGRHELFRLIDQLREEQVSIIIISHNLAHIFEVSDRIIVLRNGQRVGDRITSESNRKEIVHLIVGGDEDE